MSKKVEARLKWLKASEGGRKAVPTGPRYVTIARFEEQGKPWQKEAWSLVIEFLEPPDASLSHRVQVSFLTEGPEQFLAPGKSFELMEGAKVVARGHTAG